MTIATSIDVAAIRRHFPALSSETVFLENAGGSQLPACVPDAIRSYMLESYVQLEAGYAASDRAGDVVNAAHEFANLFMNGGDTGKAILGPSTSQLTAMLAGCYGKLLQAGDEVIIAQTGHEANLGPWANLADRGVTVHVWPIDPAEWDCSLSTLESLLNDRTRIVAPVHVSNLLGKIVDVRAICDMVHANSSAKVVVDGVALAPHRAIDVRELGVDWYVYSTYKVYGPHMAVLWGTHSAIEELTGPNHYFVPRDEVPYKFQLGGANHESCAGLLALGSYLADLAAIGGYSDAAFDDRLGHGLRILTDRTTIEHAFEVMTACEQPLQSRLLDYLRSRSDIRIIGPDQDSPTRVGTISFVQDGVRSADICAAAHARNIGVRHGHMYAHRMCDPLGLDEQDGVVRVSLVHYNTMDEIEQIIDVLENVR